MEVVLAIVLENPIYSPPLLEISILFEEIGNSERMSVDDFACIDWVPRLDRDDELDEGPKILLDSQQGKAFFVSFSGGWIRGRAVFVWLTIHSSEGSTNVNEVKWPFHFGKY